MFIKYFIHIKQGYKTYIIVKTFKRQFKYIACYNIKRYLLGVKKLQFNTVPLPIAIAPPDSPAKLALKYLKFLIKKHQIQKKIEKIKNKHKITTQDLTC